MERHFSELPLLDTARQDDQARLADPDHDLLRSLFRLIVEGETRGEVTASSLAEVGAEAGLFSGTEQQNRLRVGKVMKRRFPTDRTHQFDNGRFVVTHDTRKSSQGNGHDMAFYVFSRRRHRLPFRRPDLPFSGPRRADFQLDLNSE